jgi:FtsP/CotA-like multicopper oxidase with cupredoxin domain
VFVSPAHLCISSRLVGPFIRCRIGDVLEIHHKNLDISGIAHNIDFHAVTGPGGGASLSYAEQDQEKVFFSRMLHPGVFIYHCAAAPVPAHIANGMYGVILVEPAEGLPKVCYVLFHSLPCPSVPFPSFSSASLPYTTG